LFHEARAALSELLAMEDELHRLGQELGRLPPDSAEHVTALQRYGELQEQFRHRGGYTMEAEIGTVLKGLGFSHADRQRDCGEFSGGWQMRIALARLLLQKPDVLLLDEPTNHLDLEMRHALTLALQEYEGAIVLVSHDRHLLRTTADSLLLVADGRVQPFDGDLDDYRDWLRQREAGAIAAEPSGATRKQQKRDEAEARNQRYVQRRPLAQRLAKLERRMAELERERKPLGLWLADPESYADKEKLQPALLREAALRLELERAEEEWLALQAELEQLD
jgi:ATP-binding cassette subfamily F protein 3